MAFLASFIGSAVKFVVYLALVVAGLVCGAKFKDSRKAKQAKE